MDVSGQLHAPAALPTGKESPVPIGDEVAESPVLWDVRGLNLMENFVR
jgi:hypothetical protein